MLMWYIILALVILSTVGGLLYLAGRLAKFSLPNKMARGASNRQKIVNLSVVLLVFGTVAWALNLMNAVVCLLHFVFFWLLCDALFGIVLHVRKKSFKRYYAGYAAVVLSLASLAAGWYFDHHVWATSYALSADKKVNDLRIVLFADSHIGTTFDAAGFAKHIEEMRKQKPDLVVVVGDFVDDGTTREEMIAASRALGTLKTPYGVYFAFGNHDKGYHNPAARGFTGADLIDELAKNGVKVLQDEATLVAKDFYILGRKDFSEKLKGSIRAEMKDLVKSLDKDKFIIVLDHQPNDYANQAAAEVDLVLSGHTHGGQLFPLNKIGEWIGANDKTYGHERRRLTDFIVTSGLSDWAIKFKTGTKSEFVVIDIKGK